MKKYASLLIILAGVLWGCMGIFVRILNGYGLKTMQIVAIRSWMLVLIMIPVIVICKRSLLKIKLRDIWCFVGTGLCSVTFFNYCYFKSMTMTSLSVAAILLYTAPSMVMIMAAVLFKEKFTVKKIISLGLAFGGCILVTGVMGDATVLSPDGILVGLGAGFGYALYSIFGRFAIERGYASITITVYTFLFASVGVMPLTDMDGIRGFVEGKPDRWILIIVFAVVTTVIPYLAYTYGLGYVESGKASVLASVEPVVATLIGTVVFKEKLVPAAGIGVLLVLTSVVLLSMKNTIDADLKKNGS